MAIKNAGRFTLNLIGGDTEYIRLNVRDESGDIIDVSVDAVCTLGIKRKELDSTFIVPEIIATAFKYDEFEQPYSLEFALASDDTLAILNYGNKERKNLKCYFDIELVIIVNNVVDTTTILAGDLVITRSISGVV